MKHNPQSITLFLIEDDEIDYLSMERVMDKARIVNPLVRAKDGIHALEMLADGTVKKPFIILLDLNMPRMNGLTFLKQLRADPSYGESVVFVMTTSDSHEDIYASYKNHVAGYFVKDRAKSEFMRIADMLKGYWNLVVLPD